MNIKYVLVLDKCLDSTMFQNLEGVLRALQNKQTNILKEDNLMSTRCFDKVYNENLFENKRNIPVLNLGPAFVIKRHLFTMLGEYDTYICLSTAGTCDLYNLPFITVNNLISQ